MKTEERAISGEAFECLLAALDSDRERAGEKYELLRRKLTAFFRWRCAALPEDLADRTLDVAARRLSEGEPVQNVPAYCVGVARVILRKDQQNQQRDRASLEEMNRAAADEVPAGEDPLEHCFERCLRHMAADHRNLILQYYCGEKQEKIKARKKLANTMGIPLNALRIRAFRIRSKLEDAVRGCMALLAAGKK